MTGLLVLDDQSEGIEEFTGTYTDYRDAKAREAEVMAARVPTPAGGDRPDPRRCPRGESHAMATEAATTNDYLRGRSKKVARTAKVRERKLERMLESADLIERPERRWTMAAGFAPAAESGRDVALLADSRSVRRFPDPERGGPAVRAGDRIGKSAEWRG